MGLQSSTIISNFILIRESYLDVLKIYSSAKYNGNSNIYRSGFRCIVVIPILENLKKILLVLNPTLPVLSCMCARAYVIYVHVVWRKQLPQLRVRSSYSRAWRMRCRLCVEYIHFALNSTPGAHTFTHTRCPRANRTRVWTELLKDLSNISFISRQLKRVTSSSRTKHIVCGWMRVNIKNRPLLSLTIPRQYMYRYGQCIGVWCNLSIWTASYH